MIAQNQYPTGELSPDGTNWLCLGSTNLTRCQGTKSRPRLTAIPDWNICWVLSIRSYSRDSPLSTAEIVASENTDNAGR